MTNATDNLLRCSYQLSQLLARLRESMVQA
jgi:hypothetical protein